MSQFLTHLPVTNKKHINNFLYLLTTELYLWTWNSETQNFLGEKVSVSKVVYNRPGTYVISRVMCRTLFCRLVKE